MCSYPSITSMNSKDNRSDLMALHALLRVCSNNKRMIDYSVEAAQHPSPTSFVTTNSAVINRSQAYALQAAAVREAVNTKLQKNVSATLAGQGLLTPTVQLQNILSSSQHSVKTSVIPSESLTLCGNSMDSQHNCHSQSARQPLTSESNKWNSRLHEHMQQQGKNYAGVISNNLDDPSTTRIVTNNIQSSKKDTKMEKNCPIIRKDQIEAAFRSKPQRGRKRDNLNNLERMELTRTRNREHAKTTRLRKKARYKELLHCEEKLMKVQREKELTVKRRFSVADFVDARARMVHCLIDKVAQLRPSDASQNSTGCIGLKGSESHVDYLQLRHSQKFVSVEDLSNGSGGMEKYFPDILKNFIDNCDEFQFDMVGQLNEIEISGSSALAKMHNFDAKVGAFVLHHYGKEALGKLVYKITGGCSGIAVNKDGYAFAHVDLIVVANNDGSKVTNHDKDGKGDNANDKNEQIILLSFIISVQFAPESDKFCALEWSISKNFMNTAQDVPINQSGCQHLVLKTNYTIPVPF